jgi:hypothetical protein
MVCQLEISVCVAPSHLLQIATFLTNTHTGKTPQELKEKNTMKFPLTDFSMHYICLH